MGEWYSLSLLAPSQRCDLSCDLTVSNRMISRTLLSALAAVKSVWLWLSRSRTNFERSSCTSLLQVEVWLAETSVNEVTDIFQVVPEVVLLLNRATSLKCHYGCDWGLTLMMIQKLFFIIIPCWLWADTECNKGSVYNGWIQDHSPVQISSHSFAGGFHWLFTVGWRMLWKVNVNEDIEWMCGRTPAEVQCKLQMK